MDLEPMSGTDLQKMISDIGQTPPAVLKRALTAETWNR
jgi:hypothetical protein